MKTTKSIRRNSPIPLSQCGVFLAAELIGDKWTLLILREALYGVVRFDDMLNDLGIPRAVLTARLKRLVENDIMRRDPYREENSRTRYSYTLTDQGIELTPVIIALMQWGDRYLRNDAAPISLMHKDTGNGLKVALVDEQSSALSINDITLKINDVEKR
ncbi:winged helix-turn-helix transcriptional regulator [Alteromonas oceanisediminis]|uniref:winged helix-turn-helix transcriptional regulator n=1 Tax=Alteromonas oceanisediminis TaxID=2836180 RepID=UPI001BD9584A|nr:helix-turn-helix domain-containing protein [Alteromonas oceanisediminis]MBT0586144.1 helix-turn-helix transcriptional regulator [Alteromonas oceanisediminis]